MKQIIMAMAAFLLVVAVNKSVAQSTAPASRPAWVGPMSPEVLPGNGLSQHPFFYAGEWDTRKKLAYMYIIRDGKVAWTHFIPAFEGKQTVEYSDATVLSDGNIVYANLTGASKITPEGNVLWTYHAPPGFEVHVCQPVGKDRVLYIQNGTPATLNLFNIATNKMETTFEIPLPPKTATHGQFRRARMTAAGTFLVSCMSNNKVIEYDKTGATVWQMDVPSPWAANRLKNGNTLISSNRGWIHEVTPAGEVVWDFSQKDVPEYRLFSIQECDRLANGNTLITNWCPNGVPNKADWGKTVQALEVTPEKKVLWALRSWGGDADLGPATSLQLLDEPGVAENQEQQR